jgi:hypothetical protein
LSFPKAPNDPCPEHAVCSEDWAQPFAEDPQYSLLSAAANPDMPRHAASEMTRVARMRLIPLSL